PWSDFQESTPIDDVREASQKVRDRCGQYANAMVIARRVFRNLQDNEQIMERITSSGAGNPTKASDVTAQMLCRVFDLDRLHVADSSYDSAKEGQATTFSDIWSPNYAMVGIIGSDSMGIEEPCLGRTFHWDEDGSQPGGTIQTYYEE